MCPNVISGRSQSFLYGPFSKRQLWLWIHLQASLARGCFDSCACCAYSHSVLQTRGWSLKLNLKRKTWFRKGPNGLSNELRACFNILCFVKIKTVLCPIDSECWRPFQTFPAANHSNYSIPRGLPFGN